MEQSDQAAAEERELMRKFHEIFLQGAASSLAAAAAASAGADGEPAEEAAARATAAASSSLLELWRGIRQRLLLPLRTAVRGRGGAARIKVRARAGVSLTLTATLSLTLTRCARTSATSGWRPNRAARPPQRRCPSTYPYP